MRNLLGTITGVDIVAHDDGSANGMYDLAWVDLSGARVALEVTAAADGALMAMWKKLGDATATIDVPGLQAGWVVTIDAGADMGRLLGSLGDVLGHLEADGVDVLDATHPRSAGTPHELAQRIGIDRATAHDDVAAGSVVVTTVPISPARGGERGDDLAVWSSDHLSRAAQADIPTKLAAADAERREVFLLVPPFTTAPAVVVDLLLRNDPPTPRLSPTLPEPIDAVWIASTWRDGFVFHWNGHWTLHRKG